MIVTKVTLLTSLKQYNLEYCFKEYIMIKEIEGLGEDIIGFEAVDIVIVKEER